MRRNEWRSKARAERGDERLHALGQLVDDLILGAHNRPYEVVRVAVHPVDVEAHADEAVSWFSSEVPVLGRDQDVAGRDELAIGALVVADEKG